MPIAGTTPMAKEEDDKGLDEHTRIGGGPPKLPGAPAAPAPPAPPPSAPDEHTRLGVTPPPSIGPRPPAPAAPSPPAESPGETTRLATAPPPIPKAPVAPPRGAVPPPAATNQAVGAPPAAASPPPATGDFTEHTILVSDLQQQAVPPARLQRMQPPGRSDIITLDRNHYLVGRLPSCDLRLYSQTASREHAQLTVREGRWYLRPVAGKAVLVNGTPVKEEVPLTHKMRLQFGGDELLFLDESGVTAVESAPRRAAGFAASSGLAASGNRWLLWVVAALVLLAVLWLWAGR